MTRRSTKSTSAELPESPEQTPEERPISAGAFIEEYPRLSREARDILSRLHRHDRKTRQEWRDLATNYGGLR